MSRRTGPTATASDGWLKDLSARMSALGWSKKQLAEEAGCTPAEITRLFQRRPSRWIDDVLAAVNRRGLVADALPPPVVELESAEEWHWIEIGRRLRAHRRRYEEIRSRLSRTAELLEHISDADSDLDTVLPPMPPKPD